MGNSRLLPRDDHDVDMVEIFDYIWEYPITEAFDRSDKVYNYTDSDSANCKSNQLFVFFFLLRRNFIFLRWPFATLADYVCVRL